MVDVKLAKLIATFFQMDIQEISLGTSNEGNEKWDSLRHLELILLLEKTFDVRFLAEKIPELNTVKRIQQALAEKGAL